MVGIAEALSRLEPLVRPATERVLPLAAEGRVLAEPVVARDPVPAWARAAMDGYAVAAADLAGASPGRPAELRIAGEAYPGRPFPGALAPGAAAAIATGAPVPAGADCVVRWEEAERTGPDRVRIPFSPRPGQHISRPGEDLPAGALALTAGTVVGPLELGLLVLLGEAGVLVYRRPRVAILCTGDELVDPDGRPGPGQIRNINGPVLAALVRQAGGEPLYLGTAPDHPGAIAARLAEAPAADLYLTTGGVAQGAPDHVAAAAGPAGAAILFDRLA